ncbi:LOW QUALITY PROTEIN: hypothetical protein TorRG33x02_002640 [Trema orientale]|uniref:Uncharacterized protein n=1 Tax=Trema orientale TaxID=63057 RepID=A0A2P5G1N8_TREOI|nr:LOW QUALITY PROTEIN: hypothetical protein TorRG33x02_002640 [Trema orientale]
MCPYFVGNPQPPQLYCCDLKNPDPQAAPLSDLIPQLAMSSTPIKTLPPSRIRQRPSACLYFK